MPTYEYRCTECGQKTEAFQRMSDAPLTLCPACNKEALQRLVSGGAGVLYKGEGWYVTDYSKKSTGGKDAPAPKDAPATSTSSASTSTTPVKESGGSSGPNSPSTGGTSSDTGPAPLTKTGT